MAVTDQRASPTGPSVASRPVRDKSWVLAMLAPKRRLRVAPVPPHAADLPPPGRDAETMPGRDEGTGALIEPRNMDQKASWPCRHDQPSLTVSCPMVGETDQASHTEIRTLPSSTSRDWVRRASDCSLNRMRRARDPYGTPTGSGSPCAPPRMPGSTMSRIRSPSICHPLSLASFRWGSAA